MKKKQTQKLRCYSDICMNRMDDPSNVVINGVWIKIKIREGNCLFQSQQHQSSTTNSISDYSSDSDDKKQNQFYGYKLSVDSLQNYKYNNNNNNDSFNYTFKYF